MAVTPSSIKGGPRGGLLPPVPTQTKGRAPWEGLRAHLTSDRIRSCMVLFPGSRGPARRTDRKMWDSAGSRRHSSAGSPPTPHLGSLPSTTTRAEQAQACPPPCSVPPTLLCATLCAHSKPRTPHTTSAPRLRTGRKERGCRTPKGHHHAHGTRVALPERLQRRVWGPRRWHLPPGLMMPGQVGSAVGWAVEVLEMLFGLWVELVAGEVPGQSNVELVS